jgi:phosphosulfolactate phosphohydrolase-like enzyme
MHPHVKGRKVMFTSVNGIAKDVKSEKIIHSSLKRTGVAQSI